MSLTEKVLPWLDYESVRSGYIRAKLRKSRNQQILSRRAECLNHAIHVFARFLTRSGKVSR